MAWRSTRRATDTLMLSAAVFLGVLGAALLFAPQETGGALWGMRGDATGLAAAGLLAVAYLDWAGRGAIYGGIYGRPIVLANAFLGLLWSTTLWDRLAGASPWGVAVWVLLVAYTLAFAVLIFADPVGGGAGR